MGTWWATLKRTVSEFQEDNLTDWAAALTYYALLSLFPAVIAMVSLIGIFGDPKSTTSSLTEIITEIGPESAAETFKGPIESVTESRGTAGFTFVFGLLVAIWSASGYTGAFMRASNVIYETREGRPFWKLRPLQLAVTLAMIVMVTLLAFSLVLTGPIVSAIADPLGISSTAVDVWNVAKWPVLVLAVVLVVALLYYATPNIQQPKFRWISVGALLAIVVWIAASALFGFYVANFSSYNKTYGALAGVVVFLLWLWITNLALLFGAELDAELERNRQLRIGIAAEEGLQLPARDTRGIQKAVARQAEDVARMRNIRLAASGPGDPADRPFGRR